MTAHDLYVLARESFPLLILIVSCSVS